MRKDDGHGSGKKRAGAPDDERKAESRRILEAVARESETIGTSSFARNANRLARHFGGTENPDDDRIEIWGKRIARVLALVAFVVLFIHVTTTYILK
jgi:hypothetical protein